MKFAAKLSCVMMLVLAVSLSAGGCMLLYGDFSDRLAETSSQNQVQHGLLCYTLEGELLTRASGEIAAGAFDRRTALPGGDEVAQLSRSFDHMAAAVQDKVEQLELSVQQRDDFMGAFTHELKTPMTSIIGYADMLRSMQVDPAEQKEAAGAIFHEAKRLESLSQKLLQLMRLSEEPVALAPTALAPVFAEVARSTLPACRKAGVRLRLPTTRRVVMADADLLCDLLCNLVTNAVKASRPGQTVRVLSGGAPDGSVVAGVIDSGAGIPPEAVARVVEPFYMVDKSRARKSGGSGIGLALCQRIAQAHGSQLHIRSTLGKGTCVTLTLRPARLPDTAGPTDTEDAQKEVQP